MATALARGPLNILLKNAAGQYILLGVGVYTLFPEKVHRMLEYSPALMKLVGDGISSDSSDRNRDGRSPAPIIIHTPSPTIIGGNGTKTWTGTILYAAAGATACWGGYVVLVQLLPDTVGQFLPVTRTIFDKTSASLGKGILKCKTVLEEKIKQLAGQQEELGKKQDATNQTVSHIKSELGEARIDMSMLQSSLDRCEGSLEKGENMQQFTARGVRLLVRCVHNMLPDNQDTAQELAIFIEEQQKQLALESGNTHTDESGAVSGDPATTPLAAGSSTVTPARAQTTPRTQSNGSSSSRRGLSSTKKALPMVDGDMSDEESAFNDIRALLGH
mmetsp:Transcript_27892/g.67860  ORF Transcript_27892/g.67860 Transcript_27892/m.67860 type:complete len:331 (+) Transcript_27892:168-1160(+)|eukprot:CAMPEP_0113625892 /NCGR_PEP_ID=MMETSP0017_2-20120614/13379_1 /TAXON_ID=2856 /ORGANISM="Cylindrotheca closterium" /LENGTH=330 /DNA_ID=CAMNT_0000536031 /DNA_START=127 /DNA_END=1119 /DNA_ORIENTATION=+ /assembly_acc=CAM_ASM_000147